MNAKIKGDGGVIGLTENPQALLRWIIAGPECGRIIDEFESCFPSTQQTAASTLHHEQVPSIQKQFTHDVKEMVSTMQELGNPFLEDSNDLIILDTKVVMGENVVNNLQNIRDIGQQQYATYVQERLIQCTVPITDTIKTNKLALLHSAPLRKQSRASHQISSLKSNCELFGRLYISCQSRNGDMDDFFTHENQTVPPALSDMGQLRSCTKSDLVTCLESSTSSTQECPTVDAKVIDASATVNMIPPKECRTFGDYAKKLFVPYISKQVELVHRVDVVWDRYLTNSLKSTTRQKRGQGNRVVVQESTPVPPNWQSFLRVDENKTELYQFLAICIAALVIPGKEVYSTYDTNVVCAHEVVIGPSLAPCDHEEADTRLLLHALHCANSGCQKVMIRSVDTDVLVLAVAAFPLLPVTELWLAFGVNKHFRYIPVHAVVEHLGEAKAKALPYFHAFTGCDTVSAFHGIGKKTAWDAWKAWPQVTEAFIKLSTPHAAIDDDTFKELETFVILLYDRTSECRSINQARKRMFARGRQLERIPPTQAALFQHAKRAAYQAGHCWGQMLVAEQNLPSAEDWGWKREDQNWQPFWTTLPEATKSCVELVKCGCRKACRPPCKCVRASLSCTDLCACSGSCYRDMGV